MGLVPTSPGQVRVACGNWPEAQMMQGGCVSLGEKAFLGSPKHPTYFVGCAKNARP